MKKFPVLWAMLFSLLAVGLTFIGFVITPAILIMVTIVIYCTAYKTYYFPIMAAIWAAGVYWIFGFNLMITLCICSLTLPLALIMLVCFKLKSHLSTLLVLSSAAETGIAALWIYNYTNKIGKTAAELLCQPMIEAIKQIDSSYVGQIEEMMIPAVDLIFPSMLITSAVLIAYTVFGFSRIFLKKIGLEYKHMPEFDKLRMNKSQGVVFVILLILALLFGMISPVIYNVLSVVSTLFMVCGLSVVCYYLKRFGTPAYLRVIICVILIFIMSTFVTPLLFVMGIWDSFKPLRRNIFTI